MKSLVVHLMWLGGMLALLWRSLGHKRIKTKEKKTMLKLKVWKWTLIVIWDTGKYHVRRNPQRRSSGVQEGRDTSEGGLE